MISALPLKSVISDKCRYVLAINVQTIRTGVAAVLLHIDIESFIKRKEVLHIKYIEEVDKKGIANKKY